MRNPIFSAKRIVGRKDQMAQNEQVLRRAGFGAMLDDGPFQIGARGSRYGRYNPRYRVGQTEGGGNGGNCGGSTLNSVVAQGCSTSLTGHGRTVQECPITPARCDCHVLGFNTLNSAGIASGAIGTLVTGSGDASAFDPFYIAMFAFARTNDTTVANSNILLGLLMDSQSGRNPNMRAGSGTDIAVGIPTLIYGDQKEVECTDWAAFSSTGQQNLTLTLNMPVTGLANASHFFCVLWGIPYT